MVWSHAIRWRRDCGEDSVPSIFQAVLTALEHPASAVRLPKAEGLPWPLNSASAILWAAWVNPETPVWTDLPWDSEPAAWLRETSGCSLVTEPCMAKVAFIIEPFRMPSLNQFYLGEDDRPEQSANLILQVERFSTAGAGHRGCPGGRRKLRLALPGLPRRFWSEWKGQRRLFPLGIDVFFTCADMLIALPRGLSFT